MNPTEVATLIDELEGEVNNGGFHQYFYNSAGDNTAEVIQVLEEIGALRMAEIVRKAAARFPDRMPPKERFARQDVLLGHFPDTKAFYDLDDEFYAYPDNLSELLKKYNPR
ncbi:MAG TPA: DUF4375 domain-containing protein [Terriglobales bacterium]|nr:DUF4375 domain-containing protein [Terriglobales bacterium]